MRRIGTIADQTDARRFCDFLISRRIGVLSQRGAGPEEGHEIWIKDEAHVDQARQWLAEFLKAPGDQRFDAADEARRVLREEHADNQRRLKNVRQLPRATSPHQGRVPLTITLIGICVVVGLLTGFGRPRPGVDPQGQPMMSLELRVWDTMKFYSQLHLPPGQRVPMDDQFISIRRGQLWRLLTPALLHAGIGHLAMNMMGLYFLGSVLERLHGARVLGSVLLATALLSGLVQLLWPLANGGGANAVGASGAIYGLFGFILARPKFQPFYPLQLPPIFMAIGLGFLVLGVLGFVPQLANGAHVGGLVAGIALAAVVPGGAGRRGRA